MSVGAFRTRTKNKSSAAEFFFFHATVLLPPASFRSCQLLCRPLLSGVLLLHGMQLLYVLPVVSALVCVFVVRYLTARSKRESASKAAGSKSLEGLELLGGAHAISLASGGSAAGGDGSEDDSASSLSERHIGFVIEWCVSGLAQHARKAQIILKSTEVMQADVGEILLSAGLVAADSGLAGGRSQSRAVYSGSLERLTVAVRRLRDDFGWMRHAEGSDDVGVAYMVLSVQSGRGGGGGRTTRIQFEPCPLIFNELQSGE